ncbi:uncharacterized protein LOC129602349 [Paramacrobiotus metropolitanus]|uniref:uncharacterized protein LOC129602349 n=1 Tax=Paramacrobiotus metropolitanus TaxID=2943436 RepID=UPI002445AA49|nr:uncharacterized protein LOC129602349 [Paramacrobiotus metropolitanus]
MNPAENSAPADSEKASKRRKSAIMQESDFELLQAMVDIKPFSSPIRKRESMWQKVADKISKPNKVRTSKYGRDRVRTLLVEYRAKKTPSIDPTGDEQQPEPTEYQLLLESVSAAEEEGKNMSDAQKEKESHNVELIERLEDDAKKKLSKKSATMKPADAMKKNTQNCTRPAGLLSKNG